MEIGKIKIPRGIVLAPMEGVTDLPFRLICKRMGADLLYTEFIASEALIRDSEKSFDKMKVLDEERPIAVQIFGANRDSMIESAKIVENSGADILDINFGCWVKKVVNNNAGAAFLKNPERMAEVTKAVAESVSIPVTIKTRLGWDGDSIVIEEVAEKVEEAGAKAIAVHCRTRSQAMRGVADWSWIPKVKGKIKIPVILNGDVKKPEDAKKAFETTGCDAVMIGRAAVGYPFIFREVKRLLEGKEPEPPSVRERIDVCLEHLDLSIKHRGFPRGLYEFRKHYSGYLKGLHSASKVRQELVLMDDYDEIKAKLEDYYEYLKKLDKI